MDCVIVDIDGTLADLSHRLHHISGGRKDWDSFFGAMADDIVIEPVARLVNVFYDADIPIILCSGRPDNYRDVTVKWLDDHQIPHAALYMRPEGDRRADNIVKSLILDGIIADGYEPWLVIDDRPRVVAMWRERGLTCLQCSDWSERDESPPTTLTIMVGPSGAGKTTWLDDGRGLLNGIHADQVISSDNIRSDLCGDFRDQTKNEAVFAALHDIVRTRLRHGLPTVIDSTALRRKDRLACVALAPAGCKVHYIVVDRPMEEKRRDAGWRAELPIDLLAKHDQIFRSQVKDILAGDGDASVEVIDLRRV